MRRSIDNFDHVDAERICIIKPSALGDVIQATAVLGPLRRRFPNATISWVIKDSLQSLLHEHAEIDELIVYHDSGTWRQTWRTLRSLRQRQFDLVLDLQGLLRSGVMTWATSARWRVGLETSREGAALSYNGVLSGTGWNLSAFARIWRVAEAAGAASPVAPAYPVGEQHAQWSRRQLGELGGPLLAISPGTRWQTKEWPPENFAAVAERAVREHRCSVVLVGSKNEAPLADPIRRRVAAAGGSSLNLIGATTLPQLAAVLADCDCLLSNDSGAMHLAAAVGTPVTSVFTSTTPAISGPVGSPSRVVSTAAACAGCYKKKCPLSEQRLQCQQQVDIEQVVEGVHQLLLLKRLPISA